MSWRWAVFIAVLSIGIGLAAFGFMNNDFFIEIFAGIFIVQATILGEVAELNDRLKSSD